MKHTSMLRSFLLTVALAAVVGVVIATGCDTSLLQTTAGKAGNDAQTTILDERARQVALETEVKAQTLPDQIKARKLLLYGGPVVFLLVCLFVVAYLAGLGYRSLHTHKPNRAGIFAIMERKDNTLVDLNQIEGATYKIGTPQTAADRERVGHEVRGIRLMTAATQNQRILSPDQISQAITGTLAQRWQDRLPISPREIPAEEGDALLGQVRMIEGGNDES